MSVADLYGAKPALESLLEAYPDRFSFLHGARIVRMGETGFGDFLEINAAVQPKDLGVWAPTDLGLQELQEGDTLNFWFTTESPTVGAILLLHSDMAELKSLAKPHRGGDNTVRGTLSYDPRGWFHFRTKKDAPLFFSQLSEAIKPIWNDALGLQKLKGARLTCKDKSGMLLGRYRSKNIWPTDD